MGGAARWFHGVNARMGERGQKMAMFTCCVCEAAFEIPEEVVARYRRWNPKYCVAHRYVGQMRSRPWGGRQRPGVAIRQARVAAR